MRRWKWAALVAVGCSVGCGGGGSLPPEKQAPPMAMPGEPVVLPDDPEGTNTPTPDPFTSLYPLTAGSTWTYRIEDPSVATGPFEKQVEVVGEQPVPETSETGIEVRSTQPHLVEVSWQKEKDGVVYRVREEDHKAGTLARVTTWNPAAMKSLAADRPQGWSFVYSLTELTRYPTGTKENDTDKKKYTWSVEAVNETVTTPAGTFTNAIRLQRKREDKAEPVRTYWLVPGVGKVKETGERTEELTAYDVKKP